ncbi:Taurine catabolism dioxygenase TauD, TfdA family [compost metagenome]
MRDLRQQIYAADVFTAHTWHDGDFVFLDNHALLHGRNRFLVDTSRRIQRIHII